ncbi:MAG: ATP-binding protein [Desulfovibrio sp.]|jgi:anti-sigma regulatory factor (Ser/Thr protein kinase)|nr:ATP-binding protein [Desulfovibrio sp.]
MPVITLPAGVDQLGVVNEFIAKNLPAGHENILLQVELAVEELLVNVSRHAYKEPGGQAEIGCRVVNLDGKPYFCAMVRDFGEPFDPFKEAPEPDTARDPGDREPGGLGVHLVKHVAAHYCYSGSDTSNTIELYFPLE